MVPERNKVLLNKVGCWCRTPDSGWEYLLPRCASGSSDPDVRNGKVKPLLGEAGKEKPGNRRAFGLVSRDQVSQRGDRTDGPGAGWSVTQLCTRVGWRRRSVSWQWVGGREGSPVSKLRGREDKFQEAQG